MKKNFSYYTLIWGILLALLNFVIFVARPHIPGYVIHYDARFWIAWASIILAFICNLACAHHAFKSENLKKVFYNLPLISLSWAAMITILIVGCVFMLIPDFPEGITGIVCLLLLVFNVFAVIKASWAAETAQGVDEKVKKQTAFITNLTMKAERLYEKANSPEMKKICKDIYEALRYSDPMSSPKLAVIEAKATVKMDEFSTALITDDTFEAKEIANEMLILINERNNKCKALK